MSFKDEIVSWFKAFISPEKELKGKIGKGTWGDAFKRVIIAGVLYGLVVGFLGWIFSLAAGPLGLIGGLGMWIAAIVLTPIVLIIGWIIGAVLLFITAKLLGGKVGFSQFAIDLTWYIVPMTMWMLLFAWIPIIGGLINGLIQLYGLYPLTVVIRDSAKLSTGKAVLTWLIWLIIGIILVVIAGALMLAMIAGMVHTGSPSMMI